MGSATTDDNGVASYTYTGHGSGEMDFIASTSNPFDESSLVSETYEVLDCIYYDAVTSDTTSNYYINTNNATISYDDGIVLTSKVASAIYADVRTILNQIKGKTINIEVEVSDITDCEVRLEFIPNSVATAYTQYSANDGVLSLSNVTVPNDSTNGFVRVSTRNQSIGGRFKFKNLKVYPI